MAIRIIKAFSKWEVGDTAVFNFAHEERLIAQKYAVRIEARTVEGDNMQPTNRQTTTSRTPEGTGRQTVVAGKPKGK